MSYLDNLYSEKRRYEKLKTDITEVVGQINNVVNSMDYPITNLENGFRIDNSSVGSIKLKNIKTDLETRKIALSNDVISNINNSISSIDSEIRKEQQRLKEEQERLERERLLALEKAKEELLNGGSSGLK